MALWDDDGDWVSVDEAAERMGLDREQILALVRGHVLRSRLGRWGLEIQPAVVVPHGPQ
jgi:hypothetical protein